MLCDTVTYNHHALFLINFVKYVKGDNKLKMDGFCIAPSPWMTKGFNSNSRMTTQMPNINKI